MTAPISFSCLDVPHCYNNEHFTLLNPFTFQSHNEATIGRLNVGVANFSKVPLLMPISRELMLETCSQLWLDQRLENFASMPAHKAFCHG